MTNMNLPELLEAILFYRGEPVSIAELAKAAHTNEESVEDALNSLKVALAERGITLVREGKRAALATASAAAPVVEAMKREELEGPLGKAGLETLAIIVYQGPVSRADIEYVRGVNCTAILRSLTMRGLIERTENEGGRGYVYRATPDLPAALGLSSLADMPGYDSMREEITAVIAGKPEEPPHQSNEEVT